MLIRVSFLLFLIISASFLTGKNTEDDSATENALLIFGDGGWIWPYMVMRCEVNKPWKGVGYRYFFPYDNDGFFYEGWGIRTILLGDYYKNQKTLFEGADDGKTKNEKRGVGFRFESLESELRLFGSQELRLAYGGSHTLRRLDALEREKGRIRYLWWYDSFLRGVDPIRQDSFLGIDGRDGIKEGFSLEQGLVLSLHGKVGRKVTVDIEHNSEASESTYQVEYQGDEDEWLQKATFGRVDMNVLSRSKLIRTGELSREALGLRFTGGKDPFYFEGSLSLSSRRAGRKVFSMDGVEEVLIKDIDYVKETYYRLPFSPIREAVYYEEVRDSNLFHGAHLVVENVQIGGGTEQILYFIRVDSAGYALDRGRGFLELKRRRSAGYSLLLCGVEEGTARSADGNASRFLGTNYRLDYKGSSPFEEGEVMVLVIWVADEDMGNDEVQDLYELRSHYRVAGKNEAIGVEELEVVLVDRNGVRVDERVWKGTFEHRFARYGEAKFLGRDGVIYFEDPRALAREPVHYGGMYEAKNPSLEEHHRLSLRVRRRVLKRDRLDLGEVGIIPESVEVYRDHQRLAKHLYRVDSLGGIVFEEEAQVHAGSQVEVRYEYRPLGEGVGGGGYDKVLGTSRLEWFLWGKENWMGATFLASVEESRLNAPGIGEEPTSQFIGGMDMRLDLVRLWKRQDENNHALILESEYVMSVFDPNRNGSALVNPVDGTETGFALEEDERRYYFTANEQLERLGRRLGKAYFIDFHEYVLLDFGGGERSLLFTHENERRMRRSGSRTVTVERQDVNFRSFGTKAGPYTLDEEGVLNRGLHPGQKALVMDYDFTDLEEGTEGYVSFLTRSDWGSAARDFTKVDSLEITYKVLPAADEEANLYASPGVIGFMIEVGDLNEDLDLDGKLDEEIFLSDADGFGFDYKQRRVVRRTHIGGGKRGWQGDSQITEGNGLLDTEDLNGNGRLDRLGAHEERLYRYPSGEKAYFLLFDTETLSNRGMTEKTFVLEGVRYTVLDNQNASLDPYQREPYIKMVVPLRHAGADKILERVSLIRLSLMTVPEGVESWRRGRVVVDSIRYKGNAWQGIWVDGIWRAAGEQFSLGIVGTHDDEAYGKGHLALAYLRTYESLHGRLSRREYESLDEEAYQVSYRLTGSESERPDDSEGRFAWTTKVGTTEGTSLDMSGYREYKLHVYPVSYSSGGEEEFVYRFGEDENNYYELRLAMGVIGEANEGVRVRRWSELTIVFRGRDQAERKRMERLAYKRDRYFLLYKSSLALSEEGSREVPDRQEVRRRDYVIRKVGEPRLTKISYYMIGVDSKGSFAEGRFWVNEFYVANADLSIGHGVRAQLTYEQKAPYKPWGGVLMDGTTATVEYEYGSLGLSTFLGDASDRQKELIRFYSGTTFLEGLEVGFNRSSDYELSESQELFLPKEDQWVRQRRLQGYTVRLDVENSLWPRLSYRSDEHLVQHGVLNPLWVGEDERREYISVIEEVRRYTTVLGGSGAYDLKGGVRLNPFYETSVAFHNRAATEENVNKSEVTFYNRVPSVFLTYPVELFEKEFGRGRFPVLNGGHDRMLPLAERQPFISDLSLEVYETRAMGLEVAYAGYGVGMDYEVEDSYHFLKRPRQAVRVGDVFSRGWEGDGLYRLKGLFRSAFDEEGSRYLDRTKEYHAWVSYEDEMRLGRVFFKDGRMEFSYHYGEHAFREGARDFLGEEFLHYHSFGRSRGEEALLGEVVSNVMRFYMAPRKYKTLNNELAWRIELPFGMKESLLRAITIRFERETSVWEEDVLDLETADLTPTERNLWQGIEADFSDLSIGLKGGDQQVSSLRRMGKLFWMVPYMDLWIVEDVVYWTLRLFVERLRDERDRTRFLNGYRFWVAEEINRRLAYMHKRSFRGGSPYVGELTAHSTYEASIWQKDSFEVRLQLASLGKGLWEVLPDAFLVSGQLETGKEGWHVYQRKVRSIRVEKDFVVLQRRLLEGMGLDADAFLRWGALRGDVGFEESRDYHFKELVQAYEVGVRSRITFLESWTLEGGYTYHRKGILSPLRYLYTNVDGREARMPYMGIGPYHEVVSMDRLLGTRETLNIGELEDVHGISTVQDMGGDRLDLIQHRHGIDVLCSWQEDEPLGVLNWFTLLSAIKQELDLSIGWMKYEVPYVDVKRLKKEGRLNPADQPHALGAKNLSLVFDPIGLGNFIQDWFVTMGLLNVYRVNEYASLETSFRLAFVSQHVARTYQAYLQVERATGGSLDSSYLREEDMVQMGFHVSIKGRIHF